MLQLYIDLALSRLARHAIQPIQRIQLYSYTRYTAYSTIQRPSGQRDADLLWACKRGLHKRQFGALLHQPGHLSRHRQVETPSVAQQKAWLEAERHPGLMRLTGTDFRHLKSSQGPARTARSAKAGLGRFFFESNPADTSHAGLSCARPACRTELGTAQL